MRFTVDGEEYRVTWRYKQVHNLNEEGDCRGTVDCFLFKGDVPWTTYLLYGGARCSWRDHFNRRIGRKVALTRAIKDMPRDARKQVWEAYRQMQGGHW